MSGLVKGIGKVFKKVGKFVKKNWKYIAMAVAVYFTAGVALSYFGATSAFAAAMPGFGTGGLFTSAASAIGLSGPAIAGAAADAGISISAFASAATAMGTTPAALAAQAAAGNVAWATGASGETVATLMGQGGTVVGSTTVGGTATTIPVGEGVAEVGGTVGSTASGPSTIAEAFPELNTAAGTQSSSTSLAKTGADLGKLSTGAETRGSMTAYEEQMLKSMDRTQKLGMVITAANTAAGFMEPKDKGPVAFGVNRKGKAFDIGSNAFAGMNKNTWGGNPLNAPQAGSQYAQEGGGDQFLATPFDAGEQDYNPQAAKEFIAQMG